MKFTIKSWKRSMNRTLTWDNRFTMTSKYQEAIFVVLLSYLGEGDEIDWVGFMPMSETALEFMNRHIKDLNQCERKNWIYVAQITSFDDKRKYLLKYYLGHAVEVGNLYRTRLNVATENH